MPQRCSRLYCCIDVKQIRAPIGELCQGIMTEQIPAMRGCRQGVSKSQCQLTRIDGLGKKIHCSEAKGLQFGGAISIARQDKNRNMPQLFVLMKYCQYLHSTDLGHAEIQEQHIRLSAAHELNSVLGLSGAYKTCVARIFQERLGHFDIQDFVIYHHDHGIDSSKT